MHCSTYYVCLMILLLWVHVMYCISSPDKDWPNCVVISHVGIAPIYKQFNSRDITTVIACNERDGLGTCTRLT
jgi:hypothetical protein